MVENGKVAYGVGVIHHEVGGRSLVEAIRPAQPVSCPPGCGAEGIDGRQAVRRQFLHLGGDQPVGQYSPGVGARIDRNSRFVRCSYRVLSTREQRAHMGGVRRELLLPCRGVLREVLQLLDGGDKGDSVRGHEIDEVGRETGAVLDAVDTGGQQVIIEITEPPGAQAPLHVHHREDEGFWILDGDVTFEVADTTIEAHAGDYVFGPRDIPHRYTVGSAGCRMLFIMTPGGFEDLVIAMSQPAASRTLPPPSTEEPDWAMIAAAAKAHGCELLG